MHAGWPLDAMSACSQHADVRAQENAGVRIGCIGRTERARFAWGSAPRPPVPEWIFEVPSV